MVEPLRVVDDAQQWLPFGGLRQKSQRRERHQEGVGTLAVRKSERNVEGLTLWLRERSQRVEQRCADLVQSRESELHVGFDADETNYSKAVGRCDQLLE